MNFFLTKIVDLSKGATKIFANTNRLKLRTENEAIFNETMSINPVTELISRYPFSKSLWEIFLPPKVQIKIQGILTGGSVGFRFDGLLWWCCPIPGQTIQGYEIVTEGLMSFYSNGKPKHVPFAKGQELQGEKIKKDLRIKFNRRGNPIKVAPPYFSNDNLVGVFSDDNTLRTKKADYSQHYSIPN